MSNNEIELKKKILNSFGIHLYLAEKLIDKGYEVSSTSLTLRMGGFQLEKNGEIFDCTINILPNSEKSEYKLGFHLSNHPLKGPIEVMINALREKGLDIISSVIDTTSYTPSSYIIFSIKGQEPKVKVLLFPTGVLMDRSMPFMKFKPIKEVVKELYEQELKKSEKEQGKKERQNFSQEIDIDENLKNEIIDFRGVELSKYEATIIEHIEYLLDEKYHKAVMLKHSGRHTYDIRDQKIVGLRLDWEDLTKLPEVVLKLEYLEDLWLGANKLQKLPNSFRAIKNLKKLRLSRNKLDHIPDCIFSLSSLTKLDLTENKIEFIPPHIAKLQSLRSLFLASNNLVSIPEELFTITNLKTLYLSGNPIRDLSSTIQNLESLEIES